MAKVREVAWAAGLFEGEGCIHVHTLKNGKLKLGLSLTSTDEDVVRRFGQAVGMPECVYGPYLRIERGKQRKRQWRWDTAARKAAAVLDQLYPFLCVRRKQKADQFREALASQPKRPSYSFGVLCAEPACHQRAFARSWCSRHYWHNYRKPKEATANA